MFRKLLPLLLVLLSVATAAPETGSRKKPHKTKAAATQPAPEPAPAPTPPPVPLTPEQGPSYPPEVSFQGGQLTIVAKNSTMSDVLTAVKQRTGAAVDMPAASSERVVGRFGPGAPRDVMAQLLNGSHYDYVLLGSPADPGALKKVVLMARASGPDPAQPQVNQPAMRANPNLPAVPDIANDDQQEENGAEMPEAPEAVEQEEPQPDQQQQPGPNGPAVKTPEQLLRELQQQQQQQQNGQPPVAPPQ